MRLKMDFWIKWSCSLSNSLRQCKAMTKIAPINWMRDKSEVLRGFVCLLIVGTPFRYFLYCSENRRKCKYVKNKVGDSYILFGNKIGARKNKGKYGII